LWAVPLIALWSNAHAESILGVLLVGLFGISEWLRPAALDRREAVRTLAIAMSCALAILANPYGWGPILYMYENLSVPQLLNIAELQPAHLPAYRAFFVYLGVACVLLLSAPRRLTLWEASGALVTAALGLRFVRLTPLVFLVTAPMIAARLSAWTTRVDGRAMIVTACAAAVVISRVPLSALVTEVRAGGLHPETFFSTGAVAFARAQGLRGPLFNSNNLGGWLAWTLYPDARTFQDSRLQAYPPEHHRRIVEASQSQAAWDALVSGVDWAMLSTPRPNQLSGAGRFPSTNWATVYWDEAVEILVRRESRYAALAASHEYLVMTPRAQIFDLAPRLASPEGARIRAEARRLRSENPKGFTPAAILCLAGDAQACGDADGLAAEQGFLEAEVVLMRALRGR
jgi:hypothetical protein